jgi:hypothetical protein
MAADEEAEETSPVDLIHGGVIELIDRQALDLGGLGDGGEERHHAGTLGGFGQ